MIDQVQESNLEDGFPQLLQGFRFSQRILQTTKVHDGDRGKSIDHGCFSILGASAKGELDVKWGLD